MILAAGYLLYMYGRVVFGEVSDFLAGLGDHLTDMTPGRDPDARPARHARRHLRRRSRASSSTSSRARSRETLAAVEPSAPIAIPTTVVIGLLRRCSPCSSSARIGWVLLRPATRRRSSPKAGRPIELAGLRHDQPARGGHPDRGGDPRRRPHPAGRAGGRGGRRADRPGDHGGPDASSVGPTPATAFGGAYKVDALTTFLDVLFVAIIAMTIVFGPDYLVPRGLPVAEFAAILVFAMTGAMLISASADLLLLFLGLELMVLPGYLLAGFHKTDCVLDRGRDQVLPARLVQLGDLPVRAGVRLGPDRHDADRRDRRRPGRDRRRRPRRCRPAWRWASRS